MKPKEKQSAVMEDQESGNPPGVERIKPPGPTPGGFPADFSLFRYAPFSVIITNEAGEIEYSNKRAETSFGYRFEELQGQSIEVLIPEQLRSVHIQHRSGFKDKPFSRPMGIGLNLLGRRKNGVIFPVEIGISYSRIQGKLHIFCYATDITPRLQFEELRVKQNEFLSALHETSLSILSRLDLDLVLETIITKAIALLNCEHGEIYLFDEKIGRIERKAGVGMFEKKDGGSGRSLEGFINQIINSGQPVIENLSKANLLNFQPLSEEFTCLMGVPLENENKVNGAICIAGGKETQQFSREIAIEMLKYFGQLASIAVQNAQLFSEVEQSRKQVEHQKVRMESELKYARTVQAALLPRKFPEVRGWSFAARWKPALEVAGDYYDLILRDDKFFDMLVADVTDKGVPAALFMAHSKTLTRSALEASESLLEGVIQANREITQENVGPFVTMFLTRFNPLTGEGCYINAGHESALHHHSQADELVELTKTGLPLGIDKDISYHEQPIQLNPGDFILLYTDGVTEAMNQEFEQFGKEALAEAAYRHRHKTSEEIATYLLQEVEDFIGSSDPSDDIAILVARRL